jgi:hypothetical protein
MVDKKLPPVILTVPGTVFLIIENEEIIILNFLIWWAN